MGELVGGKDRGYRLRRLQHKQAHRVEVLGRDPLGRTISHRWRNEDRGKGLSQKTEVHSIGHLEKLWLEVVGWGIRVVNYSDSLEKSESKRENRDYGKTWDDIRLSSPSLLISPPSYLSKN